MAEIHAAGGLPPGWEFRPAGDTTRGRQAFVEYGCHACHVVQGEDFPPVPADEVTVGPELTGMGGHHPGEYFVESILNPDAVIIDGEGYVGPDGRSVMPQYPEMTAQDLGDIVAYIMSLSGGANDPHAHHAGMGAAAPSSEVMPDRVIVDPEDLPYVPPPPQGRAKVYLARTYRVKENQLEALQKWFRDGGMKQLRAHDGLVSAETYVNGTLRPAPMVTILGFRDQTALDAFLGGPDQVFTAAFAEFVVPQNDHFRDWPIIYRVDALSLPPTGGSRSGAP